MTLNAEVENDLSTNALFDPDLVETAPDSVDPKLQPKIFVSDPAANITADEQEQGRQEMAESLDGEISFQVVTDQITKTVDLKDIVDEFEDKTMISRSDAEYAAVSFENLLSGDLRLNEFSIAPSSANLPYLRTKMKRELATEQAKAVDLVTKYVQGPLQSLYKSAEVFANADIYSMEEIIKETHEKCRHWLDAREGNVFFVRHLNTMLPMTRVPLDEIPVDEIVVSEERRKVIKNLLTISGHFTNGALRTFAHSAIANNDVYKQLKDSSSMYPKKHVTVEDLIQMMASDCILELAEASIKVAKESMVEILSVINAKNETNGDYAKVTDFVSKHGEAINKNTALVHKLGEIVQGVTTLCPSLSAFIDETYKPG